MRHVDAALVHECRQARGLSLSLSQSCLVHWTGPGVRWWATRIVLRKERNSLGNVLLLRCCRHRRALRNAEGWTAAEPLKVYTHCTLANGALLFRWNYRNGAGDAREAIFPHRSVKADRGRNVTAHGYPEDGGRRFRRNVCSQYEVRCHPRNPESEVCLLFFGLCSICILTLSLELSRNCHYFVCTDVFWGRKFLFKFLVVGAGYLVCTLNWYS